MRLIAQEEVAECGLACMAMIADHYGLRADLSWFREQFSASARGSSLKDLSAFAGKLGFDTEAVRVDLDQLGYLRLPCVIHWNMTHFVVLKKVGRRGLVVFDPVAGARKLSPRQFSAGFTGMALQVYPATGFAPAELRSAMNLRGLIGRVHGVRAAIAQMFLYSVYLELCVLALPMLSKWIMDTAIPVKDLSLLWMIALAWGGIHVMRAASLYFRARALRHLMAQMATQWGHKLMWHLLSLPLSFFERRGLGDLSSRFSSYSSILRTLSANSIEAVLDFSMAGLSLLVLMLVDVRLGMLTVAFSALYVALRLGTTGRLQTLQRAAITAAGTVQAHFVESLRGIAAIRINGGEQMRADAYKQLQVAETNGNLRLESLRSTVFIAGNLLLSLKDALILAWGVGLVIEGRLTLGSYLAAAAYAGMFTARGSGFIDKLSEFRLLNVHFERIGEIMGQRPEFDGKPADTAFTAPPTVEFRDVSFRYSAHDPLVIDRLSFGVERGESVAITGASGVGKTTLLKLLLGIYRPTTGQILVDGVPLDGANIRALRERAGTVLQDDSLFGGTILDNIAFFSAEPDPERVAQAAALAAIHDDIMAMPMKYATRIGDMGSTLSGGQKQRIIVARALYRQPCLLLLDEATSHLDVANERLINVAMKASRATKIVIAHREETIRQAERVVHIGAPARAAA